MHINHGTGEIVCLVGEEIRNEVRDVFFFAERAERNNAGQFSLVRIRRGIRLDKAGIHNIAADAVAASLRATDFDSTTNPVLATL